MTTPATNLANPEFAYYNTLVPVSQITPYNVKLGSCSEETMISLLGAPQTPLTTVDQPARISAPAKALLQTKRLSAHINAIGIRPAVESLAAVLASVFASEKAPGHDLESVLGTAGTLCVRLRKPTSGLPSTHISNHAWGTAIDFCLDGHDAPGDTHDMVPRYIAVLIPFMNKAGWYSGVGFTSRDTMHFEVADQTMHHWADTGLLKP